MELIVPELVKRNGVTEQLKAENQMEWVRQMNAWVLLPVLFLQILRGILRYQDGIPA